MTADDNREMLIPMPFAILALGGLWVTLIVLSGIGLIVMTVYAFWKMRSDDFWEEQD